MEELKQLPTEQLIDLLSKYTSDYTHLIKTGATNVASTSCESILIQIQEEINSRSVLVLNRLPTS
jgi:hypothetical protein